MDLLVTLYTCHMQPFFPSQKMPSLEFGTRVLYLLISLMMCIVFKKRKHFNAMNMYFQKLHLYNSNDLVKYSYYILPCLNISNTRNPTTSPSDFPLGADIQDIAAFHKEDTRPFHQRRLHPFFHGRLRRPTATKLLEHEPWTTKALV